eukprot:TRINITY_DN4015_c0_g1_i1.p1 TRINITY_DN4015_c0_g1~~TRINITY_DN4015_c0_g1_i1.p1  ORF type:complete len:104 (+),score=17.70 TRINITY_DN4015_c0_g1_i1:219-530(+)
MKKQRWILIVFGHFVDFCTFASVALCDFAASLVRVLLHALLCRLVVCHLTLRFGLTLLLLLLFLLLELVLSLFFTLGLGLEKQLVVGFVFGSIVLTRHGSGKL